MISGSMSFGPVHFKQKVPGISSANNLQVPGVSSYHVYFGDDCGKQVGPLIDQIPRGGIDRECCLATAYEFTLNDVEVPDRASQIMVGLNLTYGDSTVVLPYGLGTAFEDNILEEVQSVVQQTQTGDAHAATVSPVVTLAMALVLPFWQQRAPPPKCCPQRQCR